MSTEALFEVVKRWWPPKCPSKDDWIKKMWYIHIMKYYSVIKINEILIHASTFHHFNHFLRVPFRGIRFLKARNPTKQKFWVQKLFYSICKMPHKCCHWMSDGGQRGLGCRRMYEPTTSSCGAQGVTSQNQQIWVNFVKFIPPTCISCEREGHNSDQWE